MADLDSEEVKAHEVRLFPTVRISSEKEAELRATAALCAMVRAVSEFGRAVVRMAKGPAGPLSCFTEVPFEVDDSDEQVLRPDAVIRAIRGKTEWKAMVEVKVGDNPLQEEQITAYHKLVRQEQFDALITISNQAALPDGLPPISLDKRRLRASPVYHLSWDRLLSEAQLLSRKKGIDDPDQQWMLDEWIKYVADPNSRIIAPPELGEHWTTVLRSAREDNLVAASRQLTSVVEHWDAFLKKVGLRLRAQLGRGVERMVARADRQDPLGRLRRLHSETLKSGCLLGTFRIPDAVGDVLVSVNLQARAVRFAVDLRPPTEGRHQTRINWLARQLKGVDAPADVLIKVEWDQRRLHSQGRLAEVLADSSCLLRDNHRQPIPKESFPKKYVIEWTTKLQKGRGRSTARVLDGIASDLEQFYQGIVERLVAYVPRAPRLPVDHPEPEREESDATRDCMGGTDTGTDVPSTPTDSSAPAAAPLTIEGEGATS